MPAKNTRKNARSKKTSTVNFRRTNTDTHLQRYAFAAIFAVVGVVFAWYAFAATATTTFSGSLNKKNPVRTHNVTTTASGTFTATGTASTKGKNSGSSPLTLKLKTTSGTLITEATGEPSTLNAPVGIGDFVIEVSSNASSANYTVNVSYPVADPTPIADTTAPTAPANLTAAVVSTTQVNLAWQSATDNVGVAGYDVLRNGVKISTTMTTTYSDVNLTPATNYTYTVKARDAAGNLSLASNTATATTQSTVDTTAPNVSISSPTNGETVAGTINLNGSASDNVGISKVEVQVGSNGFTPANLAPGTSAASATYNYSLNTTLFTDATYTVTARATDTSGNQKTTAINLTIKNSTTPPTTTAPVTQGVWVSPEGLTISVNTVQINPKTNKLWTIADLYPIVLGEARNPGDIATVGPTVKVYLQDTYCGSAGTTAMSSGGIYTRFSASVYIGGKSTCSFWIDNYNVTSHEYGHAWTLYHYFMSNNGDYSSYLNFRWVNEDGSITLAEEPRLNTSYGWDTDEIIAEDYRILFGSSNANIRGWGKWEIVSPDKVPNFREWLLNVYSK